MTGGHIEAAHAPTAMVRPLVVFVAQPDVKRQPAAHLNIVLEPEVVKLLVNVQISLARDPPPARREPEQETGERKARGGEGSEGLPSAGY